MDVRCAKFKQIREMKRSIDSINCKTRIHTVNWLDRCVRLSFSHSCSDQNEDATRCSCAHEWLRPLKSSLLVYLFSFVILSFFSHSFVSLCRTVFTSNVVRISHKLRKTWNLWICNAFVVNSGELRFCCCFLRTNKCIEHKGDVNETCTSRPILAKVKPQVDCRWT